MREILDRTQSFIESARMKLRRRAIIFLFLPSTWFLSGGFLAQAAAPTDGLVAYYPLDGNADDASGNAFNGFAMGTTPTTDHLGNGGGALQFDGATSYI